MLQSKKVMQEKYVPDLIIVKEKVKLNTFVNCRKGFDLQNSAFTLKMNLIKACKLFY